MWPLSSQVTLKEYHLKKGDVHSFFIFQMLLYATVPYLSELFNPCYDQALSCREMDSIC